MTTGTNPSVIDDVTDAHGTEVDFADFYARHWWPMVRIAVGLVDERAAAEDVVQDAFAAVYRRWDRIHTDAARLGYLRVAVLNTSRDVLRRRRTARGRDHTLADGTAEAADAPALLTAEHELVRHAMDRLPDRQREVLTLRFVTELSDADIAAATGLSEGGVRSASSRGLAALRTILGDQL